MEHTRSFEGVGLSVWARIAEEIDAERMATLAKLWASHAIVSEVVRERVMRDRVVREAFY